jgi:ferredoxin-NADP reductase
MRELSLSSAPYEDVLTTAFRFRASPAKRQFLTLQSGDKAYIQGPFGDFHLRENDRNIVFLAGGIGIVPFLSVIKQVLHEKQKKMITILISNRREEDIPQFQELNTLLRHKDTITLVNTLTLAHSQAWRGDTGYISTEMISKYVSEPTTAQYYLAGPQRFVGGMWEILEKLQVTPTRIHGEEFTGY